VPAWQGDSHEDEWLRMADISPLLGIDPGHLRASEWLSCGSIARFRYLAVWPIIEGRLHYEEQKSEDLEELLASVCGMSRENVQVYDDSGSFEYDWNGRTFFKKEEWDERSGSVDRSGLPSASVGLDLAASRFARPSVFGYAGYLRGMIIMD
jgi:hypothetical protein